MSAHNTPLHIGYSSVFCAHVLSSLLLAWMSDHLTPGKDRPLHLSLDLTPSHLSKGITPEIHPFPLDFFPPNI